MQHVGNSKLKQIKNMKKNKYLSGNFAYKTDVGKVRFSNEDQAMVLTNSHGYVLMMVCDGMGGENNGDLASKFAIDVIAEEFKKVKKFYLKGAAYYWLSRTIRKANATVFNEASKNELYHGMGTTLTIVLLVKDSMFVGQVGDSRAYRFIDHKLELMTEDQTYVGYLFRTGQIKEEEIKTHPKRHVLMNALGIYPSLNLDLKVKSYQKETLLLCSDGLYNNVSEKDIESILAGSDTLEEKVNELIEIANANGGSDNIAVVLWEANK